MAEGGGLLNRYTLQRRIEGSNPSVSASDFPTVDIAEHSIRAARAWLPKSLLFAQPDRTPEPRGMATKRPRVWPLLLERGPPPHVRLQSKTARK